MEASPSEAPDLKLFSSDERMSMQVGKRSFACIDYPGRVENVDKALDTLGGIKPIVKCIKDEKKRLDLRFRPRDVYSKPIRGGSQKLTAMLMKVRRRKIHSRDSPVCSSHPGTSDAGKQTQHDGYEYQVEIVGTVSHRISFTGMCEFQYLPVARKEDGSYENLLEDVVMRKLTPMSDYINRKLPLFIPPVIFSRFDIPQGYGYMKGRTSRTKFNTSVEPAGSVAVGRKKRRRFTCLVSFSDPAPEKASEEAIAIAERFKELKTAVEELFEERPIWPRTALMYRLRHNSSSRKYMKDVLPSLAYVFLTGPWRTFWIRLGYDPRKDPGAKRYQGIDVRRRQKGVGENLLIQPKRSVVKKKDTFPNREPVAEINLSLLREDADQSQPKQPSLRDFEFHPNVLPPYRQVCYMVCDIYEPEIQALASRNDGKETKCDERNGWCVPNFTDTCRSIMADHVNKLCPDLAVASKYSRMEDKKKKKARLLVGSDEDDGDNSVDTK